MKPETYELRAERRAKIDAMPEAERDRALLSSALDKVSRKYERLADTWKALPHENILMKLTIGELRVLRQFGRKHHDD